MVNSSTFISWTSPFIILGVSGLFCRFYCIFDGMLANTVTVVPDQTPSSGSALFAYGPFTCFQIRMGLNKNDNNYDVRYEDKKCFLVCFICKQFVAASNFLVK